MTDQFSRIDFIVANADEIPVRPSAFKHNVAEADIRHAVKNYDDWMFLDEDPDKVVFVGYDTSLRDLEIVIAEFSDGDLYIIHAMKVRPITLKNIEDGKHEI
jgi:hypothetical protein